MINHTRPTHVRNAGFTLLEVLLAMGIFVIGFSMIYAMLPAAILLQKRSIDELRSRQLERNVRMLVEAKKLDHTDSAFPDVISATSYDTVKIIPGLNATFWPVGDRSFPSQLDLEADDRKLPGRRFFWVPLFQNQNDPGSDEISKYTLFIFLMRRGEGKTYDPLTTWSANGISDSTYVANDLDDSDATTWTAGKTVPKVCKVGATRLSTGNEFQIDNDPKMITIGDKILDNNGNDYTVIGFGSDDTDEDILVIDSQIPTYPNPITEIWFAPPSDQGGPSPALKIIRTGEAFK